MREILKRFPAELFDIVVFGDNSILNQPIEEWPVVEVLIAFYSHHFPTEKALEYVNLVKPYMINDLGCEGILKDRRKVSCKGQPDSELIESQLIESSLIY